MMSNIKLLLAPFILYTLLSGGLAYLAIVLIERNFKPTPRTRAFLYIGVLVAPLVTYSGYLLHIWRSCAGSYGEFYNRLCSVSIRYAGILTPLTALALGGYLLYKVLLYFNSPIRNKTKPTNQNQLTRLEQVVQALPGGLGVGVEVWENCYPSAYVRGYRRPQIVVTTGLLSLLDDAELESVISHELAHVASRDNYLNWVFVFKELMFFSPFAQAAYIKFSQAREEAADRVATIESEERSLALASALIKVARRAQELLQLVQFSFVRSYFIGSQGISRRVGLLITNEKKYSSFSPVVPLAVLTALVMLIC